MDKTKPIVSKDIVFSLLLLLNQTTLQSIPFSCTFAISYRLIYVTDRVCTKIWYPDSIRKLW